MVDQRLWIWYCHFGLLNEKNDLNVLDRGLLCGLDAYLEFELNGNVYSRYATCLSMAYTQNGLVLCKSSTNHKERSANIFLKLKTLFEMISNTTLVCTKLVCHFAKSMVGSKKQCTYRIRWSFEPFLGYCQIAMSFGLLMHKILCCLVLVGWLWSTKHKAL